MTNKAARAIFLMAERFGHDALLPLTTIGGNRPSVRTVNGSSKVNENGPL
jgi:hypothetical protein